MPTARAIAAAGHHEASVAIHEASASTVAQYPSVQTEAKSSPPGTSQAPTA